MPRRKNFVFTSIISCLILFFGINIMFSGAFFTPSPKKKKQLKVEVAGDALVKRKVKKPKYVRGIHLNTWVAASTKRRAKIGVLLEETEINTVVIAIKEYVGLVHIPGVEIAKKLGTSQVALRKIKSYLAELKEKEIYTIARIVVFKDNALVKAKPDWAVRTSTGGIWVDYVGDVWVDPYNEAVWEYNIQIAEQAFRLGFDEIQFDYIRFPSDGKVSNCRYSQKHSSTTSVAALVGFLEEAGQRLKPYGANISIDVFGLTTTSGNGLGIGQDIVILSKVVDFISPMVYPSHYYKGAYGIEHPNKSPYETVYIGLKGAVRQGLRKKMRPYLQDFSLGVRYGEKEVREQIQACYDNKIPEWLLWNARGVYTESALEGPDDSDKYTRNKEIPIVVENSVLVSTSPAVYRKMKKVREEARSKE